MLKGRFRQISFGGIPDSRNVLFLQIFLKCAAKPSAGSTSACSKASQTFSGTFSGTLLNLTCICTKPPGTFSGTFSGALLNLTWNLLLRNHVEPDLTLHQSLPDLRRNLLRHRVEPDLAFSGSFSGTLLKPELALHQSLADLLRNLLRNPVEPDLALQQSLPNLLRNLLQNLFRNLLRNPVEPDLSLTPSPEPPSPEPRWTWPGACTKASQAFSKTFYGTGWTWLGFAPRLPGTFSGTFSGTLLNLTWLCTKASQTFTGTFSGTLLNLTWLYTLHQSLPDLRRNLLRNLLQNPVEPDLALHQGFLEPSPGTFSGNLLNLTWLCTKASQLLRNLFQNLLRNFLRNPVEPDLSLTPSPEPPSPEPRWTWPGACTSSHRSYSGLKTPLADAVGEKQSYTDLLAQNLLSQWSHFLLEPCCFRCYFSNFFCDLLAWEKGFPVLSATSSLTGFCSEGNFLWEKSFFTTSGVRLCKWFKWQQEYLPWFGMAPCCVYSRPLLGMMCLPPSVSRPCPTCCVGPWPCMFVTASKLTCNNSKAFGPPQKMIWLIQVTDAKSVLLCPHWFRLGKCHSHIVKRSQMPQHSPYS